MSWYFVDEADIFTSIHITTYNFSPPVSWELKANGKLTDDERDEAKPYPVIPYNVIHRYSELIRN